MFEKLSEICSRKKSILELEFGMTSPTLKSLRFRQNVVWLQFVRLNSKAKYFEGKILGRKSF
jgi:hypothetical protein